MTVKQAKRIIRTFNLVVIAVVLVILAFNSIYFIQEQEQAVLVTFGSPSVVTSPGIHLKIPFVQEVHLVSVEIDSMSIGYQTAGASGNYVSVAYESLMITSDFNFVNVDFALQYQVSDPERYLFASERPVVVLRNLALSYIRDTVGTYPVDEVITTGKIEIQNEIRMKLEARLLQENIGLRVVNVIIQDSVPPTVAVTDAFKNVETARQDRETAINTARRYANEQLPAARAQEHAILQSAEAQREARINDARAQVAVFNAMFEEYRKNPYMTRQRMFYETMEALLPSVRIFIDNGDGATSRMLPLDSFTR